MPAEARGGEPDNPSFPCNQPSAVRSSSTAGSGPCHSSEMWCTFSDALRMTAWRRLKASRDAPASIEGFEELNRLRDRTRSGMNR
jgi:hypothetical protein